MERYEQGTVSIQSNSNTVTGTGTRWLTYVTAGDTITINGETIEIQSVDDFNKLTLSSNYTGVNAALSPYYITFTDNLNRAKSAKRAEIMAAYRQAIGSITQPYEQTEIDSWYKQETQARAYSADNSASVPFLTAQASARGITVSELSGIIITKADAFESAMASALGTKQKHMKSIDDATTVEEVNAITW